MIPELISILDRLISLVDYRNATANKKFEKLFDPIFAELLTVQGNYIEMFEATRASLPSERNSDEYKPKLRKAIEVLREKRREFEPVRTKLRKLTAAMGNISLSNTERKFVDALIMYFPDGEPYFTTDSEDLVNKLELVADPIRSDSFLEEVRLDNVKRYIDWLVEKHRRGWSYVCETYAPLKVEASGRK